MAEDIDVVIVGAGLAGILAARRLLCANSSLRIKVLERESEIGGHHRPSYPAKGLWSYGLNFIGDELRNFILQTIKLNPDLHLTDFQNISRQMEIGILSANEIAKIPVGDFFTKKGGKALGGLAASREWSQVDTAREHVASLDHKDVSFSEAWKGDKKSAALVVLEQMCQILGIPEVKNTSARYAFDRIEQFGKGRWLGDWLEPMHLLAVEIQRILSDDNALVTDCHVVGAAYDEEQHQWTLTTRGGIYKAPRLVVAQSPWEAVAWLPKRYWPASLLQLAVKAKPVSCVSLSDVMLPEYAERFASLPNVVMITSEDAHAIISPNGEVSYQVTIDYEVSMQAPDVVKAVRRLKRARKKLMTHLDINENLSVPHLALVPIAWAQPPAWDDRRHCAKLQDRYLNQKHLMFVGDAYGNSAIGDDNIISSLLNLLGRITGSKQDQGVGELETTELPADEFTETME